MRIQRLTPWDRQPHGFARIRPEILALGLVHALMPGLDQAQFVIDHAQPSAAQPLITGYRGNDFDRPTPIGLAMQMHPYVAYESGDTPSNNAVKTLRYPVAIQPGDDLTVIWVGYLDTPGQGSNEGFGALWALGADGNGNGWGARQIANADGNLSAYYIDSSPAQYVTSLAVPGGIAAGQLVRAGYRKVGGSGRVTSFDGVNRGAATTVQGNGTMRSSTVGFDLAGSGQNPQAAGAPGGWTATGHNRCLVALVFRRALTDEQVWSLLDNPWQSWGRDEALFMPAVAASVAELVAAPGTSQPQGAAVAVSQRHNLAAAPGLSQVALGVGALVQTHVLAAAGGTSLPAGANAAVSQAHALAAAPGTSTPIGPGVAIVTSGQLQASPGVSQPAGGSVAVSQAHVLAASPGTSAPSGAAVAVTQAHRLVAAPGSSLAMAGAVAIVQRHILAAALGTSRPLGPGVEIPGAAVEVTYSAWRMFDIPAQQRTFLIEAQRRTFTINAR